MKDFKIGAYWRGRPEPPEQVARRLKSLIGSLREITPDFQRWYQIVNEGNAPELDETENWLVSAVAARVMKDDLGAPVPAMGYLLVTTNSPPNNRPQTTDVFINTHAGDAWANSSAMHAQHDLDWDPNLLTYQVVKQTVFAFYGAFQPMWCCAGPARLSRDLHMSDYKEGPVITPSWMVHLSPTLAERITPPADVTSERLADGSLFLSVTDQTFDPDNSEHVAAAYRLFAVLDTLQEKLPPEQWRRWGGN